MKIESNREAENIIEGFIRELKQLELHKLYSEEQIQVVGVEGISRYMNCISWMIRVNKIIEYFRYAIENAYGYAKRMKSPIEKSRNKQLYTFYLEDSVYRLMVCWDMYKQILKEMNNLAIERESDKTLYAVLKEIKKTNKKKI